MLTHTQRKLLLFIEKRLDETGRPPTFREMRANGYGDVGTAHRVVRQLISRGFVSRGHGGWRSLTVLRPITRFAVFKFDDEKKELVNA